MATLDDDIQLPEPAHCDGCGRPFHPNAIDDGGLCFGCANPDPLDDGDQAYDRMVDDRLTEQAQQEGD